LEFYIGKGHSLGGQSIVVPTAKGRYVLTGDIPSVKYCLFPELDKITLMNGKIIDITPLTDGSEKFLMGTFTTDYFEAYNTHYKQLLLAEKPEPEYFLPSHEPENIYRRYFG
jgi:glyoxylase-like metal-dependent hydrolase (beta-lactamase superfamily II)